LSKKLDDLHWTLQYHLLDVFDERLPLVSDFSTCVYIEVFVFISVATTTAAAATVTMSVLLFIILQLFEVRSALQRSLKGN